jgi:hypothetical protein
MVRFGLEAMMPGSDALPSAASLGLAEFVPRFRRETSWGIWLVTVVSAVAFMAAPIATVYWPVPAFLLPRRLLDVHADRISSHGLYLLRQAGLMLKMVVALHWAAHPEVRARFGLPPYPADPGTWRTT